ncbi:MAG TPA: hypothetical protein VKA10_00300, partial [Prolixibacteraceae bacterium]|nr:hypothetical protein [Prolixibacteraceae bacterium]
KRISLVLLGLLIIISSACVKEEDSPSCSYPKNAKLKRIVSCSDFDSTCPAMECQDIASIEEEYEYDSKGRLERVLVRPRYEDGILTRLFSSNVYEYNSKDQLVKIEYYWFDDDEYSIYQIDTYTYSDDGKKIRENIESDILDNQYKLFTYSDNRLTRIDVYDESDELDDYILIEYDESGNLVKEAIHNYDGKLRYTISHEYENGLNVVSHRATGSFIKTYDENENLILRESDYLSGSSKGNFRHKYEYYN